MNKYQNNLKKFISNIRNKTIYENETVVGEIDSNIIEFLEKRGIVLETTQIYLSVKAYNHMLRDFKIKKGKAISEEIVIEIDKTLNNPYKIFFDTEKERLNLIYIDKKNSTIFKIIVNPNYKTKKGYINSIITAGIIEERNLKSKFYELIN